MKKKLKPLNCFYCDHGKIEPGCSGCGKTCQPIVECTSYEICAPEIFKLYELKTNKVFVSLESWLPYHCGHFVPRKVKLKCTQPGCSKAFIMSEWAVSAMFIQGYTAPYCSRSCSGLPAHIKAKKIQEKRNI